MGALLEPVLAMLSPELRASISMEKAVNVGLVLLVSVLTWGVLQLLRSVQEYLRISRGLSSIPAAPEENWLMGHVLPLLWACGFACFA